MALLVPIAAAATESAPPADQVQAALRADPALAAADQALTRSFEAALRRLSPKTARQRRDEQTAWQHYRAQLCAAATDLPACLHDTARQRRADIEQIARYRSVFLFTRVDDYSVTTDASQADTPSFTRHHLAYPQIDSPANAVTRLWNRLQRPAPPPIACHSGDGDTDTQIILGLITPNAISTTTTDWTVCHGTPRGYGGSSTETLILHPTPHRLEPADLFRVATPWRDRLTHLAAALRPTPAGRPASLDAVASDAATLTDTVIDPAHWSLRRRGLAVAIQPDNVETIDPAVSEVVLPWAKLRDLMRPDAPIPKP